MTYITSFITYIQRLWFCTHYTPGCNSVPSFGPTTDQIAEWSLPEVIGDAKIWNLFRCFDLYSSWNSVPQTYIISYDMYAGLRGSIKMAGNVSLSPKFDPSRHYTYCTYRLRYQYTSFSFGATATFHLSIFLRHLKQKRKKPKYAVLGQLPYYTKLTHGEINAKFFFARVNFISC